MQWDIIGLAVVLGLSAFFSGAETAFTTAGRVAMEVYFRSGRRGAGAALRFYSSPELFFTIALVGNNLAAVLYSTVFALLLSNLGVRIEIIAIVSPIFLLVIGEIIPKSVARDLPEPIALRSSWGMWAAYYLLFPLVFVARFASHSVLRLIPGTKSDGHQGRITLADLQVVWAELKRTGAVNDDEAEMVDRLIALRGQNLDDVMTPRTQIIGIPDTATIEEARQIARQEGFSRYPVYCENLDHITGILYARHLIGTHQSLAEIMRPPYFVPEQKAAIELLEPFRKGGVGMAVVVDEYGGTAGIVTLEDIIEEIVGEIDDEYDHQNITGKQIARGTYLTSARTRLDMVRSIWGINLPEGDYDTLNGLILDRLGRIPVSGEELHFDHVLLKVVTVGPQRVKRVLIRTTPL